MKLAAYLILVLCSLLFACSPSVVVDEPEDTGPGDADAADADLEPSDADLDAGEDADADADVEEDADIPEATTGICEECEDHPECGPLARCIELTTGQRVCAETCVPDIPSCHRGFDCVLNFMSPDQTTCVPIGEACCIDEDADGYGVGVGCRGDDCNDSAPEINPGADELCNGRDDDCDEEIDELAVDCGDWECYGAGAGVFEELEPGECVTGACTDRRALPCGLYTCSEGEDVGDRCATTCMEDAEENDMLCIRIAHCDIGICEEDLPNGEACDEDSDCESAHCDNGFCCDDGICCGVVDDCPGAGGVTTTCDSTSTCQGTRGEAACESYQCTTIDGIPDDTACDASIEADTCGFFLSIFCTGEVDQPIPRCPSVCGDDSECDAEAHCDVVCLPDLPNGDPCDEDSDCISSHCDNNICCDAGDCCRVPTDCPASYSSDPVCDSPSTCQGTRDGALCVDFECDTLVDMDDDSACTDSIEADDCGLFPSRYCNGAVSQPPPDCATSCASDSECDDVAHCDLSTCVPDLPDGEACDEPSDCISGHCENGFCCASGVCCALDGDCPVADFGEPSSCDDASTCQGRRRDPNCTAAFECELGGFVDDDSGCVGLTAHDCGPYPEVSCSSDTSQPVDQAALCDDDCTVDGECDPGAHCSGGVCVTDGTAGDPCTLTTECEAGLQCVDGVCCTTSCTGTCMACNVAGSLGTCSPIGAGDDPDGECSGVDCSDYYHGWSGDVCFERSDAPDSDVGCNGGGGCQTSAELCPSRGAGSAHITCDDVCQDPRGGTCVGMTAGACDNVDAGTISCGVGACYNEVDRCVGGSENTCVALPAGTETCNNIDDDCDGTTDEGVAGASDSYESNNSCGTSHYLGTIAEFSSEAHYDATIYPSGDVDYYRFYAEEGTHTCFPGTGQSYSVQVRLVPPQGADCRDYDLILYDDSCTQLDISRAGSCSEDTVDYSWSGICAFDDSEYFRVRVEGWSGAWECADYDLYIDMM